MELGQFMYTSETSIASRSFSNPCLQKNRENFTFPVEKKITFPVRKQRTSYLSRKKTKNILPFPWTTKNSRLTVHLRKRCS